MSLNNELLNLCEEIQLLQEKIIGQAEKNNLVTELSSTVNSQLESVKEIQRVSTVINKDVDDLFYGPRLANNITIGKESREDFINTTRNGTEVLINLKNKVGEKYKEEICFEKINSHLELLRDFDAKSDDFPRNIRLILRNVTHKVEDQNRSKLNNDSAKVSEASLGVSYLDVFHENLVTSSPTNSLRHKDRLN